VYPRSAGEAVSLARRLRRLTYNVPRPEVPYDLPFGTNSCVYYRYGAFGSLVIETPGGSATPAIRDPEGRLVPDPREFGAAVPEWIEDPFVKGRRLKRRREAPTPLNTTIRAYEALSQRGKGGVYRALDLGVKPARLCVLKEGRRNGETDWDGRDGAWRVWHEARVLRALARTGVGAPQVYSEFEVGGNYYLAMEFVEGRNLQALLAGRRRRLPVVEALRLGAQVAGLLAGIHAAGWVWRDCKPLNLILTVGGVLRPLDFEGACRLRSAEVTPWGTSSYVPPEWTDEPCAATRLPEDLYALGATLHQLLTSFTPNETTLPSLGSVRRRVPCGVSELVASLLDSDPRSRPAARTVARLLKTHA
jgi:hypothetical protein